MQSAIGGALVAQSQLSQASALIVAAGIDFAVGDPWGWPHPVQGMGKLIEAYSHWALKRSRSVLAMRTVGIGLAATVIGSSAAVSWIGLALLGAVSPWLRLGGECILLASCFAGRSLRRAAEEVLLPLSAGDYKTARQTLAKYVGRDTDQLSVTEIYRAVLETVSENATDGVFAPLFYAILGGFVGLAGPAAIAYKAASTLDSMVGYRREPYTHLGWFSARLEDALTWLPCRISVLTVALLSGRPIYVLRQCHRDARADPSPNAGWSECAYAAALGVQLGGTNLYQGKAIAKPLLGEALQPITSAVVKRAFAITRRGFIAGLALGTFGLYCFYCFYRVS